MEDIIAFGRQIDIQKVNKDSRQNEIDYIPAEAALKIILNGRCLPPLPCSPFHTQELVLGFLLNRAWLNRYSQIESITVSGHDLDIRAEVRANYGGPGESSGPFFSVPAGSLNRQSGYTAPLPFSGAVSSYIILNLGRQVLDRQKQKQQFGGLHSAALFSAKGKILFFTEDISRHNCLDKVVGYMARAGLSFRDKIVHSSGRISIDIVGKAARMQIPVLISNSSVTHGAALLGRDLNLTVIGYAREGRFNIYSGSERVK